MKLQIQSIHFDADQKLLDYIQEKCDKVDHFFDRIIDGNVYLRVEKKQAKNNKVIEIVINVPGEQIIATEVADTFEEATDLATDNVKRQVKKYKEKLRDKSQND